MNHFHLIGYPLLVIAGLETILAIVLLRQNPHNSPINKSIAVFSLTSAGYSLFSALMYVSVGNGVRDIDLFARASWIGWLSIPAALQFLYYMKDEARTARLIGYILYPFWTVMLGLSLFTDLVVPPQYSITPLSPQHAPLEDPARLLGGVLILWGVTETYLLRRRVRGVKRVQLNYFFIGTIIFGVGVSFIAAFIQLFGGFGVDPAMGSYFSFPWVVMTFYAIMRYSLFDVRILFSRMIGIILLWLALSLLHIGMTGFLEPAMGRTLALTVSFSLIGVIAFGTTVSRRVQESIQRIIVKDRYDYQKVLREAVNATLTILDLEALLAHFFDSIRTSMDIHTAYLYWRLPDGRYARRSGFGPLADEGREQTLPDIATRRIREEGQSVVRRELERIIPVGGTDELATFMQKIGAELLVPLFFKGELLGILILGPRGGERLYLQSDLDLLETLAGHTAIAMENARLYEEAKRIKGSLDASEEKFHALANTMAAGVFIHSGGKFLYANPMGLSITGYTFAELLATDFWALTHPDFRELIVQRGLSRLGGDRPPEQYEFKIIRKNKEERWVLMTAGAIEYEGKTAVIGTIFDITKRKEAEVEKARLFEETRRMKDSLRESEEKFRTLANTMPAGLFIHRGGRFLYANPAAVASIGYSMEELLNMNFWEITHPDYRHLILSRGQERLRGEDTPLQHEFKIVRKDGQERWALMSAAAIEYEGKAAVIGTVFDITERKQAEEERAKLYEENVLQYQQRIEEEKRHLREKEKILRDLHDGIGGITTNINLLAQMGLHTESLPDIKKALTTISTLAQAGLADIRGFLHSLDVKDMNWQTLTAEFRRQGNGLIEPHGMSFKLTASIDNPHRPPGSLFCLNLFKIYHEALMNVIKHARAQSVEVKLDIGADSVLLTVADNGVGCVQGAGKGRGLTNMRSRAAELGGEFTSTSDKGTTIRVSLPLPRNYPAPGMV